jgi:hypothetical protein
LARSVRRPRVVWRVAVSNYLPYLRHTDRRRRRYCARRESAASRMTPGHRDRASRLLSSRRSSLDYGRGPQDASERVTAVLAGLPPLARGQRSCDPVVTASLQHSRSTARLGAHRVATAGGDSHDQNMDGWIALLLGIALLGLVISDRGDIRGAWRHPSRWWSRDPAESMRSRVPSQPLNVFLGVVLGSAAVIYGLVVLVA